MMDFGGQEDLTEIEKTLGFRIVQVGVEAYQCQRFDKGKVVSVSPATIREFKMFTLLCRDSSGRV